MCVSECVLIYFLSFAQLEKKNEQAEKKTVTMVLLKLFFFFTGLLLLLLFCCRYKTFSPYVFHYKRNLKPIKEMSGRKRGGGWACFPGFLVSPGGGFGAGFL